MYEELLDVVRKNKVKFNICKTDFYLNAEVVEIEINDNYIKLLIVGGDITIWNNSKIEKCRRPSNVLIKCNHCFSLYNQYDEHIGYVYC